MTNKLQLYNKLCDLHVESLTYSHKNLIDIHSSLG